MTAIEPLHCHHCHQRLGLSALNQKGWVACSGCGQLGNYRVYPAYYRAEVSEKAAPTRLDEQSSCFFHPEKAASLACDGCGRFLCSVCDIPVGKDHLCTRCLQGGKTHPRAAALENERILHDNTTLWLALLVPFLFWPLIPLTSPYVFYRAIRYFNTPSSLVRSSRWRLILSLLISTGQILFVLAVVFVIAKGPWWKE